MELLLLLSVWWLGGIAASGILLGYFQKEWPLLAKKEYRSDLGFSLLFGLVGGLIGMVIAFFLTGFAEGGWTLRPPKEKA